MGREILFRGKQVDTGEWLQGFLSQSRNIKEKPAILKPCIDYEKNGVMMFGMVDPKTVGQFTGLTDKNGKRIFEGDIIDYENLDGIYTYMVAYDNEYARFAVADDWFGETKIISDFVFYSSSKCIVTGNIHDNPELLK